MRYIKLFYLVVTIALNMGSVTLAQGNHFALPFGQSNLSGAQGSQSIYYFSLSQDNQSIQIDASITSGRVNFVLTAADDSTNGSGIPLQDIGQSGSLIAPNLLAGDYKFVLTGATNFFGFNFHLQDIGLLTTQLDVPLIEQFASPWGSLQYDDTDKTISAKGCALTSLNMIFDYDHVADPLSLLNASYNPTTLNQLLEYYTSGANSSADAAYVQGGSVNWGPAVNAATNGAFQWYDVRISSRTSAENASAFLKSSIDAGDPVVVGVLLTAKGSPSHFVVVTGYYGDEFLINDPGHHKTSLSQYNNDYETRGTVLPRNLLSTNTHESSSSSRHPRVLDANATNASALYVAVEDTVDLQVIDPVGRASGVDYAGTINELIPSSSAFTDALEEDLDGTLPVHAVHFVYIKAPVAGEYQIKVNGVENGTYTLSTYKLDANGMGTSTAFQGTANLGSTSDYRVQVSPAVPVVSLIATTPTVTAGSDDLGVFTLSLSAAQDHDVFVSFMIKGTATNGSDYVLLKTTKKIKAGKTSKPIKVIPLGVGAGTGVKRTVVLTLQPGDGYTVGTTGKVKVKIIGQ